ncbi:hypothetical protein BBH99_17030 [Chryseobacterium contaminans]|uniref:Uncharacterized protein n=1 Tax=Chryseobacterium contaminans TaxID=1423959 RepID=A0A1M7H1K1_9FLAO|nr:hypothetical protein [Chryseobacterium contaminans]OCA80020.1 hypothetical protein BBH99_17030 [Chryseobacterium contaminans]SHM22039.1 hypothetical protein SAMN05444407_11132 [Chryseobacterium contaminans]
MKNYEHRLYLFTLLIISLAVFSCKNRELNYIDYYNKVYAIDSIHRVQKDTLATIKRYKKLFREYPPVQNERITEYEVYIRMADKYHKNFGGVKSLDKLLAQTAPYWQPEPYFYQLYKRHGIDSLQVEQKFLQWRKGLNQVLVDSFSIAFTRDQYNRHVKETVEMNDNKNAKLLMWTLKNYGYPSLQKKGHLGREGQLMSMGTMLNHMAYTKYYEYFKTELLQYVKSGECTPRDYIEMVDKYQYVNNGATMYGIFIRYSEANLSAADSARIDKNRAAIGFPRMKTSVKIAKDYFDKLKKQKK